MRNKDYRSDNIKHLHDVQAVRPFISWRSVFAGAVVTLLIFAGAIALGIAMGGVGLSGGTTAENLGIFTGVWFLVSSVIAVFGGSYFAVRFGKFQTGIIGCAHGAVIAALFVLVILNQTFAAVGWMGRTTGQAIGGAASMMGDMGGALANSPMAREMVEDAIGDVSLRSDTETVISGVASRLLRGNAEGAKNYLAFQAGMTPQEADQRIQALQTQINQTLVTARERSAAAMQAAGWSFFTLILLGALSAILGGLAGAQMNSRRPLDVVQPSEFNRATAKI